jgi:tetratricopeptide (TPR) repeat protein
MGDRSKALELDPTNPRVHYLTGMSFWYAPEILGGKDKALSHLLKAEQLFLREASEEHHPLDPRWGQDLCLAFIGDIYRNKKNISTAREYYQKALALNPEDPVAKNGIQKLQNN